MIGSLVPGGPSPHVHAKRERRRAEILRVALRAFRERGYHATTLDSIAEQLGVGKTALYHYFPDKQAILLACHRESLADLERIVAQARRLDTARERLRYVIMEHVRVMTEAFGASPLAFEVGALSAERQAEIVDGRDRYERALRDIIEQGMKLGTFRRADSKVTAFAILGALNGIARWYRPEGPLDARALGELFAAQLMDGLAAGPRRNAADDAAGAEGASDIAHATTAAVRRDAADLRVTLPQRPSAGRRRQEARS